jgi:hypothetical protein
MIRQRRNDDEAVVADGFEALKGIIRLTFTTGAARRPAR